MRLNRMVDLARGIGPIWRAVRSVRFSQYVEDELFRAMFNPLPHGFYVDVGAYHPVNGSNTYKLYLRGWRGLTIEPDPSGAAAFGKMRPRDLHIVEGVANESSVLEYFVFADGKMNTFSRSRADFLSSLGQSPIQKQVIPCRPLSEILAQHAAGVPIDLLSVDCEGYDLEVLRSANLSVNRPVAIMVEDFDALRAFRDRGVPSAIQEFLLSANYKPVSQAVFTTLYAASDWRELIRRSQAFDVERIQGGILP